MPGSVAAPSHYLAQIAVALARLRYEVTLPLNLKTQKLTKIIKKLDGRNGTSVEWNIKKFKTVQT